MLYLFPFTTSLNFLFFWLTWTTLVLSHSPLRVELFGTAATRLLFYLFPSTLFFVFDVLFPSASASIKAQGQIALPTGHKRRKLGGTEIWIAAWSILNIILSISAQAIVEYTLTKILRVKSAIKVSVRLPYPWALLVDLVRGFILREVLTYVLHRFILHNPRFHLAHAHQVWYHSLRAPWPLTCHYDHPIAHFIWKFIPVYLPAAIFRFHMITYMVFVAVVSLEEVISHCGYASVPAGFLLGRVARRADLHVISGGEGNYSIWGMLDWLGGSTIEVRTEDTPEESEVEVEEAIRRAVEESKRRVTQPRNRTRRRKDL